MKISPLLTALCLITTTMNAQTTTLYEIPLKDIDGRSTTLAPYRGKVMLIVNVASKCGNTKQYAPLQRLYTQYRDRGFVVLGFPCNQFGGQEPGTNAEIKDFCSRTYNVTFPIFDKLAVKGSDQHPLYKLLTGPDSPFPGPIQWNFAKFLIGRDGKILHRFEPRLSPDSPEVVRAIEAALASP